jgi:hypothetical protein
VNLNSGIPKIIAADIISYLQIKQYIRGGFYPYIKEYWELNK